MTSNVLTLAFFLVLGIGWRYLKPQGISAESLQRTLMTLAHFVFLPMAMFFLFTKMPMDKAALKIVSYIAITSAIALGAAWAWLRSSNLAPKTKGALLIASAFGNIFFLGLPISKVLMPEWSMRIALEYGLITNVILLFTAGAVLSKSLAEPGKPKFKKHFEEVMKDSRIWIREPLIWAALAGLLLNMLDVNIPAWLGNIESTVYGALVPLLLLSTTLALNWSASWKKQIINVLPAAAIQLVLVPLVMWGVVTLFGSPGQTTTRVLLLNSMMPATLLGFAACDRYKLDTSAYALAYSLSTALALVTIPLWLKII